MCRVISGLSIPVNPRASCASDYHISVHVQVNERQRNTFIVSKYIQSRGQEIKKIKLLLHHDIDTH